MPRQEKVPNYAAKPAAHGLECLTGRLGDVVMRHIFQDPGVIRCSKAMLAVDSIYEDTFRDGRFPRLSIDFLWPLDLNAHELAFCFAKTHWSIDPLTPDPIISAEINQLATLMVDRWQALRRALSEGTIVAYGTFAATGAFGLIHRFQWSRSGLSIDPRDGDLFEDKNGKLELRWSGLELRTADVSFHDKPIVFDSARHSSIEHDNRSRKLTAFQASVDQAITARWPNGIPKGLSNKARDRLIIQWQKDNGVAVVSPRTIQRYLKTLR